ncbi:flagellar protein FlaG [Shewanella psychrotolerans]|uniref:flagellar protein FlaG n=1 Tax=Shewanella psychrotolerans TaxID=2864206 RepID=UPI001C65873C|nr:flagellar protein FlaG [Shewanella psychrotolerans]QYK00324.1 flagellar protein FlaG [Shewanella psychrotolerans]
MDINTVNASNATTAKIEVGASAIKFRTEQDSELNPNAIIQAVDESQKAEEAKGDKPQQSPEDMQKLVAELSDMMSVMRKGLEFKIDEDSGTNIVSVMDVDSGDIIRQIPNEEALELAQKLSEVTGLLMKTEA